jgi:predicted TIM-barrel fold metal-dependent hydrolase
MSALDRRQFLKGSLLTAASIGVATQMPSGAEASVLTPRPKPLQTADDIVDTNINLSRWPFRRLRGDTSAEFVDILRANGVSEAWAGSYDGLLHKNISAVNARLAEECSRYEMLVPFGSINPKLPGWEEDLRRCDEEHGMPGIRLHPNYHQYTLDEPVFAQLLDRAADRGLLVQIAVVMEDSRTQHPLVQVPVVDLGPLPDLVRGIPEARVVIQNNRGNVPGNVLSELLDTGRVWVDIARAEGPGPVSGVLENAPDTRVLFGSHAPYFYHFAAQLKMKESDLTEEQRGAIFRGNARQLLS